MEREQAKITPQVAPSLLGDEDLQKVYNWVDEIPLSRPKKNISRDFSDGVLFAEIINAFFPRLVEMHNYSSANSYSTKMYNWNTLNTKVLKKFSWQIHRQDLDDIIKTTPGAIERVLRVLQEKIFAAQRAGHRYSAAGPSGGSDADIVKRMESRAAERAEARARKLNGRDDSPSPSGYAPAGVPPALQHGHSNPRRPGSGMDRMQREVDVELLTEKEQTISELREMVDIMSEKIKKLEQLVRIKDTKIEALNQKLGKSGLA